MEQIRTILALDCATKTGWAVYQRYYSDGGFLTQDYFSGMQDFSKRRGESNGIMFLRFRKWLHEMKDKFDGSIDLVIYERAHHRGGAPTEIGYGLTGIVQAFAAEIGAEYDAVHTGTLKKFATGKGNAGKPDMIAYFKREIGKEPADDNEADAYALLRYAIDQYVVDTK